MSLVLCFKTFYDSQCFKTEIIQILLKTEVEHAWLIKNAGLNSRIIKNMVSIIINKLSSFVIK